MVSGRAARRRCIKLVCATLLQPGDCLSSPARCALVSRPPSAADSTAMGSRVQTIYSYPAGVVGPDDLATFTNRAANGRQRTLLENHSAFRRGIVAGRVESHVGVSPSVPGDVALRCLDNRSTIHQQRNRRSRARGSSTAILEVDERSIGTTSARLSQNDRGDACVCLNARGRIVVRIFIRLRNHARRLFHRCNRSRAGRSAVFAEDALIIGLIIGHIPFDISHLSFRRTNRRFYSYTQIIRWKRRS